MHAVAVEDSRLLHSIPAARVALIERIARSAGARGAPGRCRNASCAPTSTGSPRRTSRRARRRSSRGPRSRTCASRARRSHGRPLVRVFNPSPTPTASSPRTRSCSRSPTTCRSWSTPSAWPSARADLAVHLIVHPVLQVRRDRRGRLLDLGANGAAADAGGVLAALRDRSRHRSGGAAEAAAGPRGHARRRARRRARLGADARARARADQRTAAPTPRRCRRRRSARSRTCSTGWRGGTSCSSATATTAWQRGRSEDRSCPRRASGLGILARTPHDKRRTPAPRCCAGRCAPRRASRNCSSSPRPTRPRPCIAASCSTTSASRPSIGAGEVNGEHRFLGLWTSTAYHGSPRDIPVLRRKVDRVIEHFGLDPASHDGKAVLNVLETYPRDELFQAGVPDLIRIVRGVVNLYERRTVRLLVRRDPYHRFYSCLVYVPRDRYNTEVRERIEQIAREGFAGTEVESQAQISGSSHARVHVVVRTDPAQAAASRTSRRSSSASPRRRSPGPTGCARSSSSAAARPRDWRSPPVTGTSFRSPTRKTSRRRTCSRTSTISRRCARSPQALRLNLYRPPGADAAARAPEDRQARRPGADLGRAADAGELRPARDLRAPLRAQLARRRRRLDPGLRARAPRPSRSSRSRASRRSSATPSAPPGAARSRTTASTACCSAPSSTPAQIVVLRAYCRYLLQTGVPFSQAYMERTLAANTAIARNLVRLFETRFDPARQRQRGNERKAVGDRARRSAPRSMQSRSLDDDRILRAYLTLVQATLRTNFYQHAADGAAQALRVLQVRPGQDPRPAAAATEVRDLRLQPARRGRAPAHGLRRPRRHPLVRPARGLPHRGPRAS